MIELSSRITNVTSAIMLLFQMVFSKLHVAEHIKGLRKSYLRRTPLMRERPGLQSIMYIERYDFRCRERIVPSMCEAALQHKNANVNLILDFVHDMISLTPLFLGHKPTSKLMIDARSPLQFEKIKANKDSLTFNLNINKT